MINICKIFLAFYKLHHIIIPIELFNDLNVGEVVLIIIVINIDEIISTIRIKIIYSFCHFH